MNFSEKLIVDTNEQKANEESKRNAGATGPLRPGLQQPQSAETVLPGNIEKNDDSAGEVPAVYERFEDMDLPEAVLRGIFSYGFTDPSAVQQRGIVPLKEGKRDMIVQSQSGTGKTPTFVIGSLCLINPDLRETQVLVLSPTRELADQSAKVAEALGDYIDNLAVVTCVGGRSTRRNMEECRAGAQMVLGTPGRLMHMLRERALDTRALKLVVIDEADQMLELGFKDQVADIFAFVRQEARVALFSATMPMEAMEITSKFMTDPLQLLLKADELTLQGIGQYFVLLDQREQKLETLCDLYEVMDIGQSVIFVNTCRQAEWLAARLNDLDFTASVMHAQLDMRERELVTREFRSGSSRILVATDLIGRGIDVHGVQLVFNFEIPTRREQYIHRIGRSGRFGRKGAAINLICQDEVRYLRDIEKFYHCQIGDLPAEPQEILQNA